MTIQIFSEKLDSKTLEKVVKVLNEGGVIVYPTETAYGLGCDAYNSSAVNRIFKLKLRSESQMLSVIVSGLKMINEIAFINEQAKKLIRKFMPGPLVIALPKKPIIPDIVNRDRIAFRISSNRIANQIVSRLKKPLISTSANLSSKPTPYTIKDVLSSIPGKELDFLLDAGQIPQKKPSTIIDFMLEPSPQIVRIGDISPEEILTTLEIPEELWSEHIEKK